MAGDFVGLVKGEREGDFVGFFVVGDLVGFLVGPQLIWARAIFDHQNIQVNNYNKLTVEIFSKLENPIKIPKLLLKFNENTLNQEITSEEYTLSSTTPIIIEKELYFSNENASLREFILLNEIIMQIGNTSSPTGEDE